MVRLYRLHGYCSHNTNFPIDRRGLGLDHHDYSRDVQCGLFGNSARHDDQSYALGPDRRRKWLFAGYGLQRHFYLSSYHWLDYGQVCRKKRYL